MADKLFKVYAEHLDLPAHRFAHLAPPRWLRERVSSTAFAQRWLIVARGREARVRDGGRRSFQWLAGYSISGFGVADMRITNPGIQSQCWLCVKEAGSCFATLTWIKMRKLACRYVLQEAQESGAPNRRVTMPNPARSQSPRR
jgi:hypothetical protein